MRVEILGPETKSFEYVEIKDEDNNTSKVDITGKVNYQSVDINIGLRGKDAYEIAKADGYNGTKEEWLRSLSAYGIALDNGFVGTREDWLQSLTAYGIALDNGFVGSKQDWLNSLKVDLNINSETENKILTNDGVDTQWITIEDRLNSEKITWDLGNF